MNVRQTRQRLNHGVVYPFLCVRPVRPKPADRDVNNIGLERAHRREPQPQLRRRAGSKVLHEHIGGAD